MKNALLLTLAVATAMPTLPLTAYAQLPAERPQAAVLLSMTESLLATATMVRIRMANLGPIKEMKWSATYGARNWTVSLEGQDGPLRITMTGFLWDNADTGWAQPAPRRRRPAPCWWRPLSGPTSLSKRAPSRLPG